jgi:hypothetical protein
MSLIPIVIFLVANLTIAPARPRNAEFAPVGQENKRQTKSSDNVNEDPSDSIKQDDDQNKLSD